MDPSGPRQDVSAEEIRDTMLNFPQLETGYNTAAINSYKDFCRLRGDGVVPEGVKLQVRMPYSAPVLQTMSAVRCKSVL